MKVRDVMSSPPVTISPDATLRDAIEVMLRNRVGSAVVVDGTPVGIITRSDVLRAAYHVAESLASIPVARGMSDELVTTSPDRSVRSALELMKAHDIKKLPVVEEFDLVGVVTVTDIAQHSPERVREVKATIERRDDWTD
jgi:CBS domain-containing protein